MQNARVFRLGGWFLGLLVFAPVTHSAPIDCSGFPVQPPAQPFRFVTVGSACGFTTSSTGGAGQFFDSPAAISAGIMAKTSPWAAETSGTRVISTMTQCTGVGGYPAYDQRWTINGSPRHQAIQMQAGGTTTCSAPANPCGNAGDGTRYEVRAVDFAAVTAAIGTCFDQCGVEGVSSMGPGINKDAAGTFLYSAWIKSTGAACAGAAAVPAPLDPGTKPVDEDCATSAAGVMYCTSDSYGENCGYVNDKYVCLGKIGNDECWVNSDGSRVCGHNAPMPPKPDNGTRGVPATPTDTIKESVPSGGDTFNYYNSTVVSGSSQASATGENPSRATSTNPSASTTPVAEQGTGAGGSGGEDPTSDDSITGGQDCSAPPVCSGDPIACAIADQAWRTHCYPVMSDEQMVSAFGESGLVNGQFDIPTTEIEVPAGFDSSGPIAAACIADYSVNMGSLLGTVSIPFSELCWVMEFIGLLILIGSYVAGAKIVAGGL